MNTNETNTKMDKINTKMNIKAIFFDLDETLQTYFYPYLSAMDKVCELITSKYCIDRVALINQYFEMRKIIDLHAFADGKTSYMYRLEMFEGILDHFGITVEPAVACELANIYGMLVEANKQPYPEVIDVLKKLNEKYYMYVVTEGPFDEQQRAVDRIGARPYILKVFTSGQTGYVKPTGELFFYAIGWTGHKPDEVAVVGDSYNRDIVGGHKARLYTVLVDRNNNYDVDAASSFPRPNAVIKNLSELEQVLLNL